MTAPEPLGEGTSYEDFCEVETQDGMEAWLALHGHRHIMELARGKNRIAMEHEKLHAIKALGLVDEDLWDEAHDANIDDFKTLTEWIDRAKAAIWS